MGTQHKLASTPFDPEHELFCHELWLRFTRIRDPRCKNLLKTVCSKSCRGMFLFYPGSWSLSHGTLWHGYYLRFAQTRDSHAEKLLEHVHHVKSGSNVFWPRKWDLVTWPPLTTSQRPWTGVWVPLFKKSHFRPPIVKSSLKYFVLTTEVGLSHMTPVEGVNNWVRVIFEFPVWKNLIESPLRKDQI